MVAREIFVNMATREYIYISAIQKHWKLEFCIMKPAEQTLFPPMIAEEFSVAMAAM